MVPVAPSSALFASCPARGERADHRQRRRRSEGASGQSHVDRLLEQWGGLLVGGSALEPRERDAAHHVPLGQDIERQDGRAERVAPAMTTFQAGLYRPNSSDSPTGSVMCSSVCAMTSGQRNAFQLDMNANTANVASAGVTWGRSTLANTRKWPAPS
jgi:hypothetical protein